MRKTLSIFMLFLLVVTVLIPCMLLAAESTEAVPGADLVGAVLAYLPASWDGWITLVVSLCAAISAMWARPADDANIIIRLLYTVVNAIGFNAGKAKNADDAAAVATQESTHGASKFFVWRFSEVSMSQIIEGGECLWPESDANDGFTARGRDIIRNRVFNFLQTPQNLKDAAAVAQRVYGWRQRLQRTNCVVTHAVSIRSFLRRNG